MEGDNQASAREDGPGTEVRSLEDWKSVWNLKDRQYLTLVPHFSLQKKNRGAEVFCAFLLRLNSVMNH